MANLGKRVTEDIVGLSLLQAQELKTILKDKYGIEPAAGGAVMMAVGDAAAESALEETEFDVLLVSSGPNKIHVIKVVRDITGLGLKDAKDLVESGGKLKEKLTQTDAKLIVSKLVALGARAEVSGDRQTEASEDYLNTLAWAAADWLSLGSEAKRRAASLDATLQYVQNVCSRVRGV